MKVIISIYIMFATSNQIQKLNLNFKGILNSFLNVGKPWYPGNNLTCPCFTVAKLTVKARVKQISFMSNSRQVQQQSNGNLVKYYVKVWTFVFIMLEEEHYLKSFQWARTQHIHYNGKISFRTTSQATIIKAILVFVLQLSWGKKHFCPFH